jgi:hypothetical protein
MRKMTTGFYVPTESFKSIPEHVAVMFEDDQTLVSIYGASDDPEHLAESIEYARKFAAVDDLLAATTRMLNWLEGCSDEIDIIDMALEARAAINKAKGE